MTNQDYRCTGKCQGVSPDPIKYGDTSCDRWNQPLHAYEQCSGCVEKTDKDGATHWCDNCKKQ